MQTALIKTIGPSTAFLAQYLTQHHGWHVDRVEQLTSQRGTIVGRHENPEYFVGFALNDGSRIDEILVENENHEQLRNL